jgi:hypothetical protein
VFSTEGVLRHEVAEDVADGEPMTPKEADNVLHLLGYYAIGDYAEDEEGTHLDLMDLNPPQVRIYKKNSLEVDLAEGVSLRISAVRV